MTKTKAETDDELYVRAIEIRYGHRRGLWLPKIRALALRGHVDAMIELADWVADDADAGRPAAHPFSAECLYRRAYLRGASRAAHNFAMNCFNRNDLAGYRMWMRRAGCVGDEAARLQAARFETRLPHKNAAKIGRLRPDQRRDEFA